MANREDSDIDDDFSELYKEYTGPPVLNSTRVQDVAKGKKRSLVGSDEDEEPRDPNAVPTDFTSREAKVWEAKSKATERNWKKRKEEEMVCKICGESGHFTQGCPSTLGANRKSQDFFERVPAREPHVKALFSDKVVSKIETDIGCKIKIEEKFIIVSGKDRLILAKGVDAVHKVKDEGDKKSGSTSHVARSKSPERRSPVGNRFASSDSRRSFSNPQTATHFQQRFSKQEKVVEDIVREDLKMLSRGSPQAYGNDGARRRPSRSKSPARTATYTRSKSPARPAAYTQSKSPARPAAYTQSKSPARPAAYTQSKSPARPAAYTQSNSLSRPATYTGGSYNSYDGHSHSQGEYRDDGWETDRRLPDMQSGHKLEYPVIQQTVEELELEYERDATNLGRIRDKEEDEENYRHREAVREMRENYMKRLTVLRGIHAKQWEEFLQIDAQRMQQRARQQLSTSKYGDYRQPGYSDYDGSAGNPHYAGGNLPLESRGRYQNSMENYPNSRSHETYGDFQRQRHDEFGKAYNRF